MSNIALVVLDTLRKDRFDEYLDWLPGATFDHAWSTSHGTVPAHASLFTGLYASETGVYGTGEEFDFPGESLAESLSAEGFRTRGFSCNPFISDKFGFTRGFDEMKRNWSSRRLDDDIFSWGEFESGRHFNGILRYPEALYRVVRSNAETISSLRHGLLRKLYFSDFELTAGDKGAKQVLKYLRATHFDTDEFFFINLMEAHGPYQCPSQYQTVTKTNEGSSFADIVKFETERPENTRQAYTDCVRYLSDIYKKIFQELQSSFDCIVTIADHGEQLGEDNNWGHNFGIHPTVTNIPFSIWCADESHKSLETNATVSILDAYTTVLHKAGITPPEDRRGVNLFEAPPTQARLTEYHGIAQPEKAEQIRAETNAAMAETYDSWLRGVAHPEGYYLYETICNGEHEFRTTSSKECNADQIQKQIEKEHSSIDIRPAKSTVDYDDSLRDELEHLGYL